ncbi:MAG: metal-dependent hydrolase [Methanomicrobiales archaeon]|nr:metal-dependent hydrolase [Methanomicrobiales archaeon]
MKGVHHLLLTTTTGGFAVTPLVPLIPPEWLPPLALGLVIGSLAPDADASDAAILHAGIPGRGTGARGFSRWILPLFGYLIRYLVYLPVWAVLRLLFGRRCSREHRGLLHSLLGVTATALLTSGYLALFLFLLGHTAYPLLVPFGLALLAGAILHLVEDTTTVTGIRWAYPWSDHAVHGTLRTGGWNLRPTLFLVLLTAGATLILAAPLFTAGITPWQAPAMLLFLLGAWTLFLLSAGVGG